MKLTVLGTGCMMPTKERNHAAMALEYKGDIILFDCGEGIQRQFSHAGLKISKIKHICITHFHGDHSLGLPGVIQSLAWHEYDQPVKIYGPKGSKKFVDHMVKCVHWDKRVDVKVTEVKDGVIYDGPDYTIEAHSLKHRVPCIGFAFIEKDRRRVKIKKLKELGVPEGPQVGRLQNGHSITWRGKKINVDDVTYWVKGKKFAYITDTGLCNNCYTLAQDADLVVSEATYHSKLANKADAYDHLTARDAALVASKANAKKLILTHYSSRYKSTHELEEDARNGFDNVMCAKDLMKITF